MSIKITLNYIGGGSLSIFKTRAVVIKTQDIKESDKLVWLFSEKLGKISTIAKGAKKNRSNLFSTTLQFCFGDYVTYKGKSLYNINESLVIDSFQEFLTDLETLTYASYICELIDICMQDGESNRELFRELVTAFYLIKNKVVDLEILARCFETKVLKHTGYGFNFNNCSVCRKKINTAKYISFQYSGGICESCEKIGGINISSGSYSALKYLYNTPIEKIHNLSLPKQIKSEICKVLSIFISQNYFRKPKSLETLNYLTGFLEK